MEGDTMRVLLVLFLMTSLNGMDNNPITVPPKFSYHYDYSVHYCENNEEITHHYESEHDNHKEKSKFKKRFKKIRVILTAIIVGLVSGVFAIADKML